MFIIGVVNVADCKQNVNRHLNSAQRWLSDAEQAFDKDKDIRGELNLFLAQAELTHAREVNRSQQWRYKYPVLRHSMAFGLAMAVAIGGVGASYWWGGSRHQVQPVSGTHQSVPVLETSSMQVPPATKIVTPASSPALPETASVTSVTGQSGTTQAQPAGYKQTVQSYEGPESTEQKKSASDVDQSKDVPLTTDEINKLIRTAGQSLRGQ